MIIVLSIDGICYEDLYLNKLPNLKRLAEQGTYTKRLRTVFPSVTWSIHTSVITGKAPGQHGIVGNTAFSRSRNKQFGYFDAYTINISAIRQPTIFEKAAAKGKTTAAVCWPLTQGSPHIQYNIPECYSQDNFDKFSTPAFVKELLEHGMEFGSFADWSCESALGTLQDDLTCRIAEYLITQKSVDVLFAHFLIHDSFQHHFGIQTPESEWSLRYADSLIKRIIDSLRSVNLLENSHVIVFSDHGHETVNKYFDLESYLRRQGIPEGTFHCVSKGGVLFLYSTHAEIPDSLLVNLCTTLERHEAVEIACVKERSGKLGLDSQLDPDTFPDIIAALNHGWLLDQQKEIRSPGYLPGNHPRAIRSSHGYLPETHPRMDGFMIRSGERFQKGLDEESGHICDIYKIVENLLIEE